MNVLFVCTGNTCRSPMAEALARHKDANIQVKSAGIYTSGNIKANEHALKVLEANKIQFEHRSQQVSESLIDWAHIILTMTEAHKETLLALFPETVKNKCYMLTEYVALTSDDTKSKDIIDPFGGSIDVYKKTFNELDRHIEQLLDKIRQKR